MINFKPGVDPSRLREEMLWALLVADKTYHEYGESLTVTSTYEGKHKDGSLHYKNRGVDLRLPASSQDKIVWEIRTFLGRDYDVVEEPECIHIEWDPR